MRGDQPGAALRALGSATLGESGAVPLDPRLKAVWPGAAVAGPACPVRCAPGDNLPIHVAVATAEPNSVLVVDVGALAERGYFGEVLATAALARGLAGLVIDGGVRDTDALAALGFPVFASMVALAGATKQERGTVGRPVTVGGATVAPRDWVVGDADGVVVVPAHAVASVVEAGRARQGREQAYFEALRSGQTTLELLGLDASLVEVAATGSPEPSP